MSQNVFTTEDTEGIEGAEYSDRYRSVLSISLASALKVAASRFRYNQLRRLRLLNWSVP